MPELINGETRPFSNSGDHYPGFDGLRLLAALSVLFSHAFLIATGSVKDEPFVRLLGPDNIIGIYGVYAFFIISGFLLARALAANPDVVRFGINRVLRIYPGYVFCAVTTALVLGGLGSSLGWQPYLHHPGVFGYVASTLSCLCDVATLPGVYAYQGINQAVVNGSLWSLSYEVMSYLLLVWVWLALRNAKAVAITLMILALAVLTLPFVQRSIVEVAFTLPYFAGGVLMSAIQQRFGLNARIALCCVLALSVAAIFGLQHHAFALFGAYLIVFAGSRPNLGSALAARVGDLSYGLYLFGWPVEQLTKRYSHTDNPWLLLIFALPCVVTFAALSCHLIEQPALRLKRPIAAFVAGALKVRDPQQRHAARIAATWAFLAAAAAILLSGDHAWFVTRSLLEVSLAGGIGATLALLGTAALRSWRQ